MQNRRLAHEIPLGAEVPIVSADPFAPACPLVPLPDGLPAAITCSGAAIFFPFQGITHTAEVVQSPTCSPTLSPTPSKVFTAQTSHRLSADLLPTGWIDIRILARVLYPRKDRPMLNMGRSSLILHCNGLSPNFTQTMCNCHFYFQTTTSADRSAAVPQSRPPPSSRLSDSQIPPPHRCTSPSRQHRTSMPPPKHLRKS